MECPYCKAENRDGVRFCGNCGREIEPTATTTTGSRSGNSRSLTPGSRLQGGRYVIKKILGQGGMGAALLATDNRLDSKSVVIKELISDNTDPTKRQEDVLNFKREVSTLAHIDHPLVPSVTDHFQEGSRYFMVQEYVEGENLEERMDRLNQPMKERDVLGYASEVLDILDYLSQQTPPIIHRDIKPANIIIGTKDKRAHLVDFGIARADVARNVQRKQTSALGTPGYAPPEQYQGNADPRSDLYALAATLHHLLTNRDPRNHPPFTYPPVRTLNPALSPEIERVLTKALQNDVNQRYQSAAAMKQAIDDILLSRFGVSGNTGSYTLGTSGSMGTVSPPSAASAPTVVSTTNQPTTASSANQPTRVQPRTQQPPPPVMPRPVNPVQSAPYQAGGMGAYGQQPQRSHVLRNFLLLLFVILLIAAVLIYFNLPSIQGRLGSTATPTPTIPSNGIGVVQVASGEYIGVSDGSFAFDTSGPNGNVKRQAADKFKAGDVTGAESLWNQALSIQTNDAETLIYMENQRVVSSGSPYITIVVGTMLSGGGGTLVSVGRDDLQGAYVAQKEFNDGFKLGGVLVRLLVASSGGETSYASTVANQIVQAAKADHTIVGVMGWPFSSRALQVIDILTQAHIPMVSQTASSDLLTNKSPYFFRVAPSNKAQAVVGVQYAEQTLHAKNVALFLDPLDSYSNSLANDFKQQFTGGTVFTEQYTVAKPQTLLSPLQDALKRSPAPDLIYFSGYASDVSTLLTNLETSGAPSSLRVLGGDALYELGGYQSSARASFNRLHFTAFAYPDEWDVLGLGAKKPAFFSEYSNAFDPERKHRGSPYGYTRPDNDVILSYDATIALLSGVKNALAGGKTSITPDQLQQGLKAITGPQAIQGVGGQISFGTNGDPINKAVVMLYVDPNGFIKLESVKNSFLVGS